MGGWDRGDGINGEGWRPSLGVERTIQCTDDAL